MKLCLSDIDAHLVQPRFERALRKRVGNGTGLSRYDFSKAIGCDTRTVDGWMNDGRLPPLPLWFRLCIFFGPDFSNEIWGGIEVPDPARHVSLADLTTVEASLRAEADRIRGIIDPPAPDNVTRMEARRG